VEKTDDGFYLFESLAAPAGANIENTLPQMPIRRRNADFYFKVLNPETQLLEVDIVNTPIADVINDIGNELDINVFTATPLDNAGIITSFKADAISFDELLAEIFEMQAGGTGNSQNQSAGGAGAGQVFTFKKEDNIYFFGTRNQLSVHSTEIVPLVHRSLQLLKDPSGAMNQSFGFSGVNTNYYNQFNDMNRGYNNYNNNNNIPQQRNINTNNNIDSGPSETLLSIIPIELQQGLTITPDFELNSFYVNGPNAKVERFKRFVKKIDQPVPVVLIEVMFVEFSKSALIETGVTWGIGDEPQATRGQIFPNTDLTLGAHTVNKIVAGFDGFEALNIGKLVPNFYATIKAMETNGRAKIRSTPKLATLNGHRATFSNGQTSYYAVTQRNIYGTDNPQISEITNYVPINAKLGLTIKPLVSDNGQVTLDIFVIQSSFGTRIDENAPPNISSREFSSIIRVQDGDIVVLGGLEKRMTDNSGTGVPFLSKIPIIKWLFSSRKRESSKSKLTVFIKPIIFD
jgi:type IV pilus assembly protein PilQ